MSLVANNNTGFVDPRTAAELLLAPARPKALKLARFGSLKLNIGGVAALPGQISKAADVTGALRHQFGSLIALKSVTQSLSLSLNSTLSNFDTQLKAIEAGRPALNPLVPEPTGGVPSAGAFLGFSSLKPGQPISPNVISLLRDRKLQLQGLSGRLAGVFTGSGFKGVSIEENFSRTPYPLTGDIDLPSIPRLAQGGSAAAADNILKSKRRFALTGVHIGAGKPSFWSRLLSLTAIKAIPSLNSVVNQVFRDRKNGGSWSEPASPYAAQFPYNKVQQTESGHVIEFDDTPGAERVHIYHRSGSFIEMHPDGTVIYKNMKDGYDLTMGDKFVKVSGAAHISVDGNATVHTKGNLDVQCDGEFNVHAKKDFNVYASNINLRAKKTFKADGVRMDLRYINLPTSLIPVPMGGGFAPRVNIAAIKADFPKSNIDKVLKTMSKNPLDPKTANLAIALNPDPVAVPPENPLSNPGVYLKKTLAAQTYRARFFDTPEETDDYEQYSAHISLQSTLGDTINDPRQLGGRLASLTRFVDNKQTATVNYLNFDDFKGTFEYADDYALGGTSFRLRDLVDIALYPDIVPPLKGLPANTVTATSTTTVTNPETGETVEIPVTTTAPVEQ